MLSDKQKDLSQSAEKCLKHFLNEIELQFENIEINVMNKILEILISQCKFAHDQARITTFEWVYKFLQKFAQILSSKTNKNMFMSINSLFDHNPSYEKNLYSTKEYFNERKKTISEKNSDNKIIESDRITISEKEDLNQIIPFHLFPKILDIILHNMTTNNESISKYVSIFL